MLSKAGNSTIVMIARLNTHTQQSIISLLEIGMEFDLMENLHVIVNPISVASAMAFMLLQSQFTFSRYLLKEIDRRETWPRSPPDPLIILVVRRRQPQN